MKSNKIFFDTYTSIKEETTNIAVITNENSVCLKISIFMFSLALSFIIELCNLIPLTASANMHGMNKIFCSKTEDKRNIRPLPNAKT